MRLVREVVPSMFHRRLLLIAAAVVLTVGAVGAQLVRLAVVQGAAWQAQAESVLVSHRLLPTVRGRILDRRGKVLAADVPCDDVKVRYDVIAGRWAYEQARREAWKANRDRWGRLSQARRELLVRKAQHGYDGRVEQLWQAICEHGHISREELEARKAAIVRRVAMVQAAVWERQARQYTAREGEPAELEDIAIRVSEQNAYHTLLAGVDGETAALFGKLEQRHEGLRVEASKRRAYARADYQIAIDMTTMPSPLRRDEPMVVPVRQAGHHILGKMRDVWAEDVDAATGGRPYRRPDGSADLSGYLPGDRLGMNGVEWAEEDRLRGKRGRQSLRRDTQEIQTTLPEAGRDARITIDMQLQARIQAALDPSVGLMQVQPWHRNEDLPVGTPLNGAVVVMEVDSGQILAMVTSPAAPPDTSDAPAALPGWPSAIDQPAVNRPLSAVYPPGSTLKPIVYAIAAGRRAFEHDQHVECRGHLLEGRPTIYRCWIYKMYQRAHGLLGPVEAIARSCNIYFYTAGQVLGARRLVEGLHDFGFDSAPGTGLPQESAGILPYLDRPNPPGRGLTQQNAILIGIGQGPIAVTPQHVATAHAALARGGYFLSPVLIEHRQANQEARDLDLPPRVVDNVLQGMWESANADHGTGHHLSLDTGREPLLTLGNVTTRAKTGTAQAPTQFDDLNENGRLDQGEPIIRAGSHSWYVCHVQRPGESRAAFVIVTMVEYGGSGGRVSGPVTNQVLHALRAEGYL